MEITFESPAYEALRTNFLKQVITTLPRGTDEVTAFEVFITVNGGNIIHNQQIKINKTFLGPDEYTITDFLGMGNGSKIVFNDEHQYTLFLLKWC